MALININLDNVPDWIFKIFAGLFAVGIGIPFLISFINLMEQTTWDKCPAIVKATSYHGSILSCIVEYTYERHTYKSEAFSHQQPSGENYKFIAENPAGSNVNVYVSPDHPESIVVTPEFDASNWFLLLAAVGAISLGIALLIDGILKNTFLNKAKNVILIYAVLSILICAGAAATIGAARKLIELYGDDTSWVERPCQVLYLDFKTSSSAKSGGGYPKICYEYEYNGVKHLSSIISLDNVERAVNCSSYKRPETCFVDASNPERACLDKSSYLLIIILCISGTFTLIPIYLMIYKICGSVTNFL
ncbi:MAG: DUF3592 domain-containing protein [Victivallaceae bacterium]|nr:DUF3592 domain-containing protein [Victivallaceae bacterium]